MKKSALDISAIVLNFNTRFLVKKCIQSVIKHTKRISFELIVVDNASTDGSQKELKKLKEKHRPLALILNKENVGFGKGNNLGIKKAKGRYILLLNSDTQVYEDSLPKMISWMDEHPKVGAATCQLRNKDGSIQGTGGSFPTLPRLIMWALFLDDIPFVSDILGSYHPHTPHYFSQSFYKKTKQVDWITGAFMLLRKEAADKVGGFDPKIFMYTEDVEYCLRLKKSGWEAWYVPITSITHFGGASSGGEEVEFKDGVVGKERSIVGEFLGLRYLYEKHFKESEIPARLILKTGALLRILLGALSGQKAVVKIYAKAFQIS